MHKWQTDPTDAAALAAFRWHANRLENLAISKYVTRRETFDNILAALSKAARELRTLNSASNEMCSIDADCPRGYHCNNGDCEPDEASN
ncbi:MAG TPA: hypothetical protein VH679_07310 [Vicinamibacterales bacterium]|jgi:hypothetical protein